MKAAIVLSLCALAIALGVYIAGSATPLWALLTLPFIGEAIED